MGLCFARSSDSSRRDCFALSVLRVCLAARQPVVGPLLMDLQSERPKGDEVAAKALAVAKRKTCLDVSESVTERLAVGTTCSLLY